MRARADGYRARRAARRRARREAAARSAPDDRHRRLARDGRRHRRPRNGPRARQARDLRRAPDRHLRTAPRLRHRPRRSEEHTSELQSLMRISYAVFCLKKKKTNIIKKTIRKHTTATNTSNH